MLGDHIPVTEGDLADVAHNEALSEGIDSLLAEPMETESSHIVAGNNFFRC